MTAVSSAPPCKGVEMSFRTLCSNGLVPAHAVGPAGIWGLRCLFHYVIIYLFSIRSGRKGPSPCSNRRE